MDVGKGFGERAYVLHEHKVDDDCMLVEMPELHGDHGLTAAADLEMLFWVPAIN